MGLVGAQTATNGLQTTTTKLTFDCRSRQAEHFEELLRRREKVRIIKGGGGKKKISPVKYSIKTGWMVGCRQNTSSSNKARQSFFSTFLPQS